MNKFWKVRKKDNLDDENQKFNSNIDKQEHIQSENESKNIDDENIEDAYYEEIKEEKPEAKENSKKEKINFNSSSFQENFFKKKSRKSIEVNDIEEEEEDEDYKEINENKKDNYNKKEEEGSDISYEDLFSVSEFCIELIDSGISMGCSALSKGDDSSKYEISKFKKQNLSRQLANILDKYSFKLSIEFLFFISFVLAFSEPVRSSIKSRREKSKKENDEILDKKESKKKQSPKEKVEKEVKKEEVDEDKNKSNEQKYTEFEEIKGDRKGAMEFADTK